MKHYYFVSFGVNHAAVSSCVYRGSIQTSTVHNREVVLGSPILSSVDIRMVEEMIASGWTGGFNKADSIKVINFVLLRTE